MSDFRPSAACRSSRSPHTRQCLRKWGDLAQRTWAIGAVVAVAGCAEDQEKRHPPLQVIERTAPAPSVPCQPNRSAQNVPETSTYRIQRGGTLRNVANLYKIHHHEIVAMNPGVDPDERLAPLTPVITHRSNGEASVSIGLPHAGRIENAMPMMDGPGRIISAKRWKTWATRTTVRQLDAVLREWKREFPEAPPVLVGNLSSRHGGALDPHKTHQSGRDVDLGYILKWDGKSAVRWQQADASNFDAARTWALLQLLVRSAPVEVVFADRSVQRLLLEYARTHGVIRKSRLGGWLQVAASDGRRSLVRHVPGHRDHFHVRFACSAAELDCES